jgi:ubiquinone biosynthesis protein COQ9
MTTSLGFGLEKGLGLGLIGVNKMKMMMINRPSSTSSAIVRVVLRGGSSSRRAAARPLPSSSFSVCRCSLLLTTNGVNASAMELRSNRGGHLLLFSTRQYYSSSSSESLFPKQKDEQIRKAILSAALHHVHDIGWTDDAIASAVLDCNYPPSYIGRVLSSSTSSQQSSYVSSLSANNHNNDNSSSGVWGNGQLVAHFMEECNNNLRDKLMSLPPPTTASSREGQVETNNDVMVLASHINTALQLRLSMVVPFINSQRWHEGMAIGALPQNALMTMSQLNDMADIVLSYATAKTLLDNNDVGSHNNNSMHKMAIIAAYAAAELHLLSSNVTSSSATAAMTTTSLSGDRHDDTWTFLEARSSEAAHVIINGGMFPSLFDLPPAAASTIQTASAITSSLVGSALSLASPNAASMVGRVVGGSSTTVSIVPQVLDSVIGLVQSYVGIGTTMTNYSNANNSGGGVVRTVDGRMKAIANGVGGNKRKGDGTRPSDYAAIEESLPPFDTTEEIFGSIKKI